MMTLIVTIPSYCRHTRLAALEDTPLRSLLGRKHAFVS